MNKTSLMLLNDYISLPEHNKLRLARFVQSINPDYALTKSNKDMLLMAISDFQKDVSNKTRLAAIESLLKTSVGKTKKTLVAAKQSFEPNSLKIVVNPLHVERLKLNNEIAPL